MEIFNMVEKFGMVTLHLEAVIVSLLYQNLCFILVPLLVSYCFRVLNVSNLPHSNDEMIMDDASDTNGETFSDSDNEMNVPIPMEMSILLHIKENLSIHFYIMCKPLVLVNCCLFFFARASVSAQFINSSARHSASKCYSNLRCSIGGQPYANNNFYIVNFSHK